MPRPLRLWSAVTRPALLRSAALFAASAAAGPLLGQTLPPGAMPPGAMAAPAGDPFAGGAFAVPTAGPVAVAYGDPATLSSGTIMSAQGMPADGTVISGPMPAGNQVFMAPQVIGGQPQMMGSPMPGSPGCNCGPGGSTMMDPSMMGMPMGTPSYGAPMMGPTYGGAPGYYDDGCCLNDGCCLDALCGAPAVGACDPCQTGVPVCDPCQSVPPAYGGPGGGIYHGMGGAPRCGWSTSFT